MLATLAPQFRGNAGILAVQSLRTSLYYLARDELDAHESLRDLIYAAMIGFDGGDRSQGAATRERRLPPPEKLGRLCNIGLEPEF